MKLRLLSLYVINFSSRTDQQFHGFDDTELRSARRMNRSKSLVLQKSVLGSNDRIKPKILEKSVLGSNDRSNSNDLSYKPPRRFIRSQESSNEEIEDEIPSLKKKRETRKNPVKKARRTRRKEDISYEPNSEDSGNLFMNKGVNPQGRT